MQYFTKRPVESPTHQQMLDEYLEEKRIKEEEEILLSLSLDEFYDPWEDDPWEDGRRWEDDPWEDIADEWERDWDYHDDYLYDY